MIGKLVGHYRVLEKIGAGGMGEVFRARDERLGRDVALKLIRSSSSDNPDHRRRFEQEARAAAALNHPNILAIFDVGFEGKSPYIVSELLEGKTLRMRLGEGRIPVREAAGYALQIAQGLIAAHDRHIVHRDLKPENLFVTHDGRVKILDFGVAKLQPNPDENRSMENLTTVTKHGSVIGTVAYMSPEQLRGKALDHRSDIFSFGAILFEMLSGHRAFRGETEVDTMTAVLREEPSGLVLDEAAIPLAYQDVIRHCIEKEPENRFQSAKDLGFALQTLSGSSQVSTVPLARPKSKSGPLFPWAAALLLAATAAALAVVLISRSPATNFVYTRLTFEAGTVYAARFTPNGESVIYSAAWDNKPTQLFSTVANSLLSQALALNNANLLSVSRTNELALAVGGIHSGQMETVNGMLAQAPLAGGSPRDLLSDVRWADWDPQGKLAVVHAANGQSRLEYPMNHLLYQSGGWISDIRFNPAGDQIAFMDHPALWDNRGAVRITDLSGHVRTLTRQWDTERGLAWRPDGKEIWFTAVDKGVDLNLIAVDLQGKARAILDLPGAITLQDIAPDGRVLISLNSPRLSMGFTTLNSTQDIDLSWHDSNSARDISRDGQFLLFEDSSAAAGPGYAVAIRKVDGTLPIRLGEGSGGGLSPDGKWAISVSTGQQQQITLLPTGAGQPRTIQVTGLDHIHNGWARFLPDGQRISILGDQQGHAPRCYLVDASTGKAQPVTPDGVVCGAVSPDNRFMVPAKSGTSLTLYSLDGKSDKLIRLSHDFNPVQWSDNGTVLFGYHWGEFPSKVYQLEIATGKETLLHELKPGVPAGVVLVAPIVVSRDGKYFAYSYNQTLSVLYLISGLR
jgi:eukaryotic-like serine/threonine-protein kinase